MFLYVIFNDRNMLCILKTVLGYGFCGKIFKINLVSIISNIPIILLLAIIFNAIMQNTCQYLGIKTFIIKLLAVVKKKMEMT